MPDAADLLADLRLPRPDRAPIYDWARRNVQLPEAYATPGPFTPLNGQVLSRNISQDSDGNTTVIVNVVELP